MSSAEFPDEIPGDLAFTPENDRDQGDRPGLRLYLDLADVAIGLNVARDRYESTRSAYAERHSNGANFVLNISANIRFSPCVSSGSSGQPDTSTPSSLSSRRVTFRCPSRENSPRGRGHALPAHAVGAEPGERRRMRFLLAGGRGAELGWHLPLDSFARSSDRHRLVRTPGVVALRRQRDVGRRSPSGSSRSTWRAPATRPGAHRLLSERIALRFSSNGSRYRSEGREHAPTELIAEMEDDQVRVPAGWRTGSQDSPSGTYRTTGFRSVILRPRFS